MTQQPQPGGASVDLAGIGKSYGRARVLDDLSMSVPAGSFTTFLGPSGSGKTTTLSIVAGLVDADEGRVHIGGRDCTRLPVAKRDLGFVFQSYALFPHLSVERNIAFPLTLRRLPKAEIRRRVAEAVELVRLHGFEKRYPSQLSGGQQQRVALARAVVYRPRVLLMDEPLGALDAGLRAHLQREIVQIGRELGITILYVTHDQDEALSMSDQIVLFNAGRIEQIGDPHDLYARPASPFAARFIGHGTFVEGIAEEVAGGWQVRLASGRTVPVRTDGVDGIAAGRPLGAMIRPESVALGTPGEAGGDDLHEVDVAEVTDRVYVGDQQKIHATLPDGTVVEHRCDPAEAWRWSLGDRVSVGVSTRRRPFAVPVPAGQSALDPVPELAAV